MNDLIASIDIGGTHLRCALSRRSAPEKLLARRRVTIQAEAGVAAILEQIHAEVLHCLTDATISPHELTAVGCTVPGFTDAEAGIVVNAANLRGWREVPLTALLTEKFHVPAVIENDVRSAAIGEYECGAGKGMHSLVYFTISTGVSAGIIVNGRLWRGFNNVAGEIAYFVTEPQHLDQDWGDNGCLEWLAAGMGIASEWKKNSDSQTNDAIAVFNAARNGNVSAQRIIQRATDYLAQTAIALCTIINPQMMILGGGIAENEPAITARITRAIQAAFPFTPQITLPALGSDAPLAGIASLAARRLTEQ